MRKKARGLTGKRYWLVREKYEKSWINNISMSFRRRMFPLLGYYEREEDTNSVIWHHNDGAWIHTGDIGYVNENGIVFVKDRIKRMIIRSGFKVFPSEIENLFLSHKAVKSCSVIGIPDKVDVTAPQVHVVLEEQYKDKSESIKTELIKLFYNSELPPYFEPVSYVFRDEMPLRLIGKVDYRKLEEENR